VITLYDLSCEFWRNALGGKNPIQGYELTLDRLRDMSGRIIVCCDSPRSARKEKAPSYKSNRPPKPPEAIDALRAVENRIADRGIPIALVDGWEADDVIATICAQAWPEEVAVTGAEKDYYALLAQDHVTLYGPKGRVVASDCEAKFGVQPRQMTDWLALAGDASDGVPGCPGVGPGRATDLLVRFGNISSIKAAARIQLEEVRGIGKNTVFSIQEWDPTESLDLVTLRSDLPIKLVDLLPP
jgi:DNA polymerase-1